MPKGLLPLAALERAALHATCGRVARPPRAAEIGRGCPAKEGRSRLLCVLAVEMGGAIVDFRWLQPYILTIYAGSSRWGVRV